MCVFYKGGRSLSEIETPEGNHAGVWLLLVYIHTATFASHFFFFLIPRYFSPQESCATSSVNKAKPQHEQKEIQFRNKHPHTQTTKHQTVVYVHARLCVGYSIYIGRDSVAGSHTFYSGEREQKDRNLKKNSFKMFC